MAGRQVAGGRRGGNRARELVRWRLAAVSDGVGEVYLSAVGIGVGPDSLSLARLEDGADYHFDLKQPLRPRVLSASARAADGRFETPPWQRQDWHADQLRLMRESEHTSAE